MKKFNNKKEVIQYITKRKEAIKKYSRIHRELETLRQAFDLLETIVSTGCPEEEYDNYLENEVIQAKLECFSCYRETLSKKYRKQAINRMKQFNIIAGVLESVWWRYINRNNIIS